MEECKSISLLDCKLYLTNRGESRF